MIQLGFIGVAQIFTAPRKVRFEDGALTIGDVTQEESRAIIKLLEGIQVGSQQRARRSATPAEVAPKLASSAEVAPKLASSAEVAPKLASSAEVAEVAETATPAEVAPKVAEPQPPKPRRRSKKAPKPATPKADPPSSPKPEPATPKAAEPELTDDELRSAILNAADEPDPEPEADLAFEPDEAPEPYSEPTPEPSDGETAGPKPSEMPENILNAASVSDVIQHLKDSHNLGREQIEAWVGMHADQVPVMQRIGDRMSSRLDRLLNMLFK